MGLLDNFGLEMNRVIVITENRIDYDPVDGSVIDKWVPICDGFPCILYSKALAEKYFGDGLWKESTEYVACLKPVDEIDISSNNRALVGNLGYAIDSVDDVAYQGEILLIGLRAVR